MIFIKRSCRLLSATRKLERMILDRFRWFPGTTLAKSDSSGISISFRLLHFFNVFPLSKIFQTERPCVIEVNEGKMEASSTASWASGITNINIQATFYCLALACLLERMSIP